VGKKLPFLLCRSLTGDCLYGIIGGAKVRLARINLVTSVRGSFSLRSKPLGVFAVHHFRSFLL
jgi:hypothetical protein